MAIRLLSSESIDGTFKIGSGSLTNPSTNADDIVIDNGAGVETGMTFASSVASSIRFGDFTNNSIGCWKCRNRRRYTFSTFAYIKKFYIRRKYCFNIR